MQLVILMLCTLVAVAVTAPAQLVDSQNAQIISYESENIGLDGYRFS